MSKIRGINSLPQKCYAILPYDGRLVTITQGIQGYTVSPLDTDDRYKNRDIANEKNNEFGVITLEDEREMINGAIFGWEFIDATADSSEKPDCIIQAEISRPGLCGTNTATIVMLPATPYELADAMEKARITDGNVIYTSEVCGCSLEYLPKYISPSVNIYELNYLAQRLKMLQQWELDCFEGMVRMDAAQIGKKPIAVERLINMTYSMLDCRIIYDIYDDLSLGQFYIDNDFISELTDLPEKIFSWLDNEKIGKEMHEDERGVFTSSGYVVQDAEIVQVYKSGDSIPRHKPDYAVLIKIKRGSDNGLQYDNDLTSLLKLPATEEELFQAAKEVEAASLEECVFIAADCIVPALTEEINHHLEENDGGSYHLVNELSKKLKELDQTGSLPTYKAMLEMAADTFSLEEALELASKTEGFSLMREAATPADYARLELEKSPVPLKEELIRCADLYHYGDKLMEHQNASATEYGVLISHNGQTVRQCLECSGQRMKIG